MYLNLKSSKRIILYEIHRIKDVHQAKSRLKRFYMIWSEVIGQKTEIY